MIFIGIGSANRDPEYFDDPDTLNIARTPNRHISLDSAFIFVSGLRSPGWKHPLPLLRF